MPAARPPVEQDAQAMVFAPGTGRTVCRPARRLLQAVVRLSRSFLFRQTDFPANRSCLLRSSGFAVGHPPLNNLTYVDLVNHFV